MRAAVELAKEWRTDRSLSRLEAMLAVANKDASLIITGNGDVVEPEHGLIAMGSGGGYAQAAASALLKKPTCRPGKSSRPPWASPAISACSPTTTRPLRSRTSPSKP